MAALEMVAEKKAVDTAHLIQCDDAVAGQFNQLGAVAQGSFPYNRVGRQIKITSIHFKGFFSTTATAPTITNIIRVFICCVETAPPPSIPFLPSNVYSGITNTGAAISITPLSSQGRNLNFTNTIKVLAEKTFFFAPATTGVLDTSPKVVEFYLNNLNIKQLYSGQQGADLNSNVIFLCTQSSNPAASPNQISLVGTSRLKYIDI